MSFSIESPDVVGYAEALHACTLQKSCLLRHAEGLCRQ